MVKRKSPEQTAATSIKLQRAKLGDRQDSRMKKEIKRKIVITGGHVTPALALIEELVKDKRWNIFFIGRKIAMEGDKAHSFEFRQVTARGIAFIPLSTGRIQRAFTRYTLLSLAKIPFGILQSFFILLRIRPCGVVSFGGYMAAPVVIVAKTLGIPVVTHEQTTIPGLANRLIALLADVICLGFPQASDYFPREKTVITGNPLRGEFLRGETKPVVEKKDKPILYISGGSLGAHVINRTVAHLLPDLLVKFTVVHQCGASTLTNDYHFLSRLKKQLSKELAGRYLVAPYFNAAEVVWLMKHSLLVVSRAGANTVSELAFIGKPAILIPLPHAGSNEQQVNAKLLAESGLAVVLRQSQLTANSLFKTITAMVQKIHHYEKKATLAKKLIIPDASRRLAQTVEATFLTSE